MTDFRPLAIPAVLEVTPKRFGDNRGFFSEVFKRSDFLAQSIFIDWVQDNHSLSQLAGTVRGLHYQSPPQAQHKLVRVTRGAIFDVAVDIRKGSPTYGRWAGCEISANAWNQLLVPIGFAHGFMTLVPDTEVIYKVSAPYAPELEGAIRWNDPAICIPWPEVIATPTLSDKDKSAAHLADLQSPFLFEE